MIIKKVMKLFLFSLVLVFITISFTSAAIPQYTDKYLNDFANIFTPTQVAELRGLLYYIDTNTTAELVVVTDNECASKGGQTQYAIDILNTWKVGKADKNNGLVALYCKQENKIFITVGYGLEGILPDSKIGRLLDENYVPLRDSGNVSSGIIAVMNAISQVVLDNREEVLSGQASPDYYSNTSTDYFTIIIWTFIAYVIISRLIRAIYNNKNKNKKGKNNNMPWFLPFFIPFPARGGSGSFSGGGSFGGGGFGGGMGGGGGAGR